MNDVKLLPPGCKETVRITPGQSCLNINKTTKKQAAPAAVETPMQLNPFDRASPLVGTGPLIGNKKRAMKSQPKKKNRHAQVPVADLDLLINPTKRKTDEQLKQDEDMVYNRESPNPPNLFAKPVRRDNTSKYDENASGDDIDDDQYSDYSEYSGSEHSEYTDEEDFDDDTPRPPRVAVEPALSRKEMIFRKAQVLARLERREKFSGKKIEYDPNGSLEYLEVVDAKYNYKANSDVSVQIMRRALIFAVGSMETMAHTLTFLQLDLTDWSQSVCLALETYDEILFEIYDYYSGNFDVNPLLKLAVAVLSSAMMHSFTRKMFASAKLSANQMPMQNNFQVPTQQGYNSGELLPQTQTHSQQQQQQYTSSIDAKEAKNDDEVGVMSGPDDISEEQLLEMFRREEDQRVPINTLPIAHKSNQEPSREIKEVVITTKPKKRQTNGSTASGAANRTVVSMT